MGEFSPVQLDALEDALEDLELVGIPGEFEDDAAVSGRLSEYRDLLHLSREALPPVEVPIGALDNVLALAREEAAATPAAAAHENETAAASPWWKRISLWVPMLAVGASAALVLVMVRGTLSDQASEAPEAVATASKADAASPKMDDAPQGAGPLLERADELQAVAEPPADGVADDLRLGGLETRGRLRGGAATDIPASEVAAAERDLLEEDAEAPEEEEAKPAPPTDPIDPTDKVLYDGKDAPTPSKPSKKSSGKSSANTKVPTAPPKPSPSAGGGKGDASVPGGVPQPEPSPEPNDDGEGEADPLARAEQDRKAGRCGAARKVYGDHVDDADDSVRARALAGLGLCALAEGDSKAADAYFSRAKKADGRVGSFISRERAKIEAQPDAKAGKKQSL